jgi:plastocyanin
MSAKDKKGKTLRVGDKVRYRNQDYRIHRVMLDQVEITGIDNGDGWVKSTEVERRGW